MKARRSKLQDKIAGYGIRDLLQETALEVSMLAQGGSAESVAPLRQRCQHLVAAFDAALERRGIAADVREDAVYAQCGLLDEVVLTHLPPDDRSQWDATPLQVERFQNHDAGERVYGRLALRLREVAPNVDLLECYAAILGLGFKGKYARPADEPQRVAVITELEGKLATLRPDASAPFITDVAGRHGLDGLTRLSPWIVAGLACIVTALVYLGWGQALNAQLAHLLTSS